MKEELEKDTITGTDAEVSSETEPTTMEDNEAQSLEEQVPNEEEPLDFAGEIELVPNSQSFCGGCGYELHGEKFCPNCGKAAGGTVLQEPKKGNSKKMIIGGIIAVAIIALVIVFITVIQPNKKYNQAIDLASEENYEEAIDILTELDGYKDSVERIEKYEHLKELKELKLRFKAADTACISGKAVLSSDGTSINVDSKDQYDVDAAVDILSIITELELPDTLFTEMCSTTALMGRQTKTYGDIEVSWSYHPDNGLDVFFRIVD